MFFLPSNRRNLFPNLVYFYDIVLVSVLTHWRRRSFFRTAKGHDHFIRGAKKHRGGVGDLLVHVESNVDRLDVGFGRKNGL